RLSTRSLAGGSAARLLSPRTDLSCRKYFARRYQSFEEPGPSLVSLGDAGVGDRIVRTRFERVFLPLVFLSARANDPAGTGARIADNNASTRVVINAPFLRDPF